jgi:hypothetical protein
VALAAGDIIATNPVSVIYFASGGGQFVLLNNVIQSAAASQAPLCGATHLKLSVSSATQAVLTADTVVMTSSGGLTQTRGSFNQTLTITNGTSPPPMAANGMDGETPGTNTWLDVFAIDNGAAPGVLGSLASGNGLAPVMPAGYTFKCYMGAIFSTGAAQLQASQQNGNRAQWVVGGTGITNAGALNIANGNIGGYSGTSPTGTAQSIASWVPPTATAIRVDVSGNYKAGGPSTVLVGPNSSWFGTNNGPLGTNGAAWPCAITSVSTAQLTCDFVLENNSLYWASSAGGAALGAMGWTDAVNAN